MYELRLISGTRTGCVLLHGRGTWALRKAEHNLLESTEMRMLRWMMGVKRIEKIRNEDIRARAGVVNIREKIRQAKLRIICL